MTFKSEFIGNDTDRSGAARFKVGIVERMVHFTDSVDYHAVCTLLNEARKVEREACAREFLERARLWAEQI